MSKLVVLHWFPLEQYPPVTNLLRYFSTEGKWAIDVCSCRNVRGLQDFSHQGVAIHRSTFPGASLLEKLVSYLSFPVRSLWALLRRRPQVLLYMEPHSALPAFIYCLFFRQCRLFIHYHEYRDRSEYRQPGMRLVRIYHWLERIYLFRRAEWISHTNVDRNQMFLDDCPMVDPEKINVLPNYPLASWSAGCQVSWPPPDEALRLVYVGAVSIRDTFIRQLIEWIESSGRSLGVTLDVYSYNNDAATREFLASADSALVTFHNEGLDYADIPAVLAKFHVGLILYKGNTRNYVFNASNKLFEYLNVGLDVWYPKQMLGVRPFAETERVPRVFETDLENLALMDFGARRTRDGMPLSEKRPYSAEFALTPLREQMSGHG